MRLRWLSTIFAAALALTLASAGCVEEPARTVGGGDMSEDDEDNDDQGDGDANQGDGGQDNDGDANQGDTNDGEQNGGGDNENENNQEDNGGENGDDEDANDDNGDDGGDDDDGDDGDDGSDDDNCTDLNDSGCTFDCQDLSTWPDDWLEDAVDVVAATNAVRTSGTTCQGQSMPAVDPLDADARLEEAARCHSLDMGEMETLSHQGSDGSMPDDRFSDVGYNYQLLGENVAMGQSTPQNVVDAWLGSTDGHCENLMNADFEDIGVGVVVVGGTPYWTQKFGTEL